MATDIDTISAAAGMTCKAAVLAARWAVLRCVPIDSKVFSALHRSWRYARGAYGTSGVLAESFRLDSAALSTM